VLRALGGWRAALACHREKKMKRKKKQKNAPSNRFNSEQRVDTNILTFGVEDR
jgi:hypothetical protein